MDNKAKLAKAFPIGVKYGQHRDMQEKYWDYDFANMRACGIDALRVHAFWAPMEPREGEYDFAQYDRITRKAEKYGIQIMFTLYLMASPEWIFQKHADSRFVSGNGKVWNSNQGTDNAQGGWPGLCFDSLPFRKTVEAFAGVFVEHYRGDPNVLAIDIWHEPTDEAAQGIQSGNCLDAIYCYCKHSIAGFRKWLLSKYGDLDTLNRVWTRHYLSWDMVEPPHNVGTFTDWLDWKTYRLDAISNQVHWLGAIVKKYDPERATSVHLGIIEMGHPITHSNDHFRIADATDMFACSLYDAMHEDLAGFTGDLMRSACDNGPFWIGETGTGSGPIFSLLGCPPESYHCFARPLQPEQIFKLTWSNIAHGAKGIFFWAWRPDISTLETLSLGFTERNGEGTVRTQALKAFTDVFRQYRDRLAEAFAPKSDACILYNMDSMIIEGVVSLSMRQFEGQHFKDMDAFVGSYRLCMKNGIQPDYISKERLEAGGLKDYKLLILPYSISIGEDTAKAIRVFVENGGMVISDAMLGFFTDEGWGAEVCPPHGLDQVFGLSTSSDYHLVSRCDVVGKSDRYRDAGCHVSEKMRLTNDAETVAKFSDDTPALVAHTYGKGRTAYLGTIFFANVANEGLSRTNGLFRLLLDQVGYQPDKTIDGPEADEIIEVRRLIGNADEFVFLINHTNKKQAVTVCTRVSRTGTMEEILAGRACSPVTGDTLVLAEEMEPLEVKVFHIHQ